MDSQKTGNHTIRGFTRNVDSHEKCIHVKIFRSTHVFFLFPVCQATIEEFEGLVNKLDPDLKVDVGGYRLDTSGNLQKKTVSQANSETHLSDMLDSICDKMDDYIRATKKSDGSLIIMKIITENGQMNPLMSEVDVIQDDDLNKSLKYYVGLFRIIFCGNKR